MGIMTGIKNTNNDTKKLIASDKENQLYPDKGDVYVNTEHTKYRKGIDFLSYNNGEDFMVSAQKKALPLPNNEEINTSDEHFFENDENQEISDENAPWDDSETVQTPYLRHLIPSAFIFFALAWTGFFIWSNISSLTTNISASEISTLIINWSAPTILITMGWLLFMRSSAAEAIRFGDVGHNLQIQAQDVQDKMHRVNEDIALARDFLSQYAQDLEHLGRHSVKNLQEASSNIEIALLESKSQAEKLHQVSTSTNDNLDLLRKHLPVVNSAAKDATNMIGKAGMEANEQMKALQNAMADNVQSSLSMRDELETLSRKNTKTVNDIKNSALDIQSMGKRAMKHALKNVRLMSEKLSEEYNILDQKVSETQDSFEIQSNKVTESFTNNLKNLSASLYSLSSQSHDDEKQITNLISKINEHLLQSEEKMNVLQTASADQIAQMAFALNAIKENSDDVGAGLKNNHDLVDQLITRSEKLLIALDSNAREMDETIPASAKRLNEVFADVEERFSNTFQNMDKISEFTTNLDQQSNIIEETLSSSHATLKNIIDGQGEEIIGNVDHVDHLLKSLTEVKKLVEDISVSAESQFSEQVSFINKQIDDNILYSRDAIQKQVQESGEHIAELGSDLIQSAIEEQVGNIETNLKQSLNSHIDMAGKGITKLQTQLTEIEQMTDNVEKRVAETSQKFSGIGEESFARQMALLTESLNSTAIDVTKIISNDVTDTAWEAYLKGDRGVFTRRAVKLLSNNEAKTIINHYDENMEFREHVNRYIHDFEAMMRVLLSTRDGNAIGVTILSSDVGKLYVALAQAIERLRH